MFNPIAANLFLAALCSAMLGGITQTLFVALDYPTIPGSLSLRNWLDRRIGYARLKKDAEALTALGLLTLLVTGLWLGGLPAVRFVVLVTIPFQLLPLLFRVYCQLTSKWRDEAGEEDDSWKP